MYFPIEIIEHDMCKSCSQKILEVNEKKNMRERFYEEIFFK